MLFGTPFRFIPAIRQRAPHWHRAIGKGYGYGACGAALLAIYHS